jgi:predicted DCC family thiol-disulfide oxidoreductase YuxK
MGDDDEVSALPAMVVECALPCVARSDRVRLSPGRMPGIVPASVFHLRSRVDSAVGSPLPRRGEGSNAEHIFYDGHCGLCHRAVRFVLAEDRDGNTFRFAPLDSDAFRAAIPEEERKTLPDSIVVRTADGRTLTQASAILYIMQRLGGLWRIIATVAKVIPPALLDVAYAGIARIRYRLFAKPPDACPIQPPKLRGRFDF